MISLQPTTYHLPPQQRGYIALVSAIVISVLLLAITSVLSLTGFFGRFNVLDAESKERSQALAEACVDTALLNFAQNSSYNPSNQVISVGLDSCKIVSKAISGSTATFKTQGVFNKSYSNFKVVVDSSSLDIISWDECSSLGGC